MVMSEINEALKFLEPKYEFLSKRTFKKPKHKKLFRRLKKIYFVLREYKFETLGCKPYISSRVIKAMYYYNRDKFKFLHFYLAIEHLILQLQFVFGKEKANKF
ncbi:hypothetical protein [Egyptian fruit bat adenovirus]|uniref:Uncharacterized protein n=1 Tax=Egyptian fruit bat adenovirus TaxID=2849732 RepID=A0A344X9W0_9ADEN|nr:hypothetical protein QKD41_gp23 [Rousettus aegyptiacus adenovirus]AXE75642.1 hypothetical protein [Egyptian fruit bat adenovirus]